MTSPATGDPGLRDAVVDFTAGDGLRCNLIHVEGRTPPVKGPVLLVHGAGVRANIFRAPTDVNVVDALVASGYDVWLENWRASVDLPANPWTLDQAAVFDHPEAVRTVLRRTGADTMQALIHCQGSTSFMMSALAGLVPQVTTIVSNAVSVHTVVPRFSAFKLRRLVPVLSRFTDYLDCQWGASAPTTVAKVVDAAVQATHHECHNPVCKECSFDFGSGRPALWLHENLSEITHEWVRSEFKWVPMTFYRQMRDCVRHGHLVSVDARPELPADFVHAPIRTDARITLLAGERNLVFCPESQRRTYEWLDRQAPGRHRLHMLPNYSHLDVFMGSAASRDVFPLILAALDAGA